MFTVDASVYVNALNRHETGSRQSRIFLEKLHVGNHLIYSPTLLLVEVAAAVSRALDDSDQAISMALSIRDLPGQNWIALDDALIEESLKLAATFRLRSADAVCGAVAKRCGAVLVTRDSQQSERLRDNLEVASPETAILRLI